MLYVLLIGSSHHGDGVEPPSHTIRCQVIGQIGKGIDRCRTCPVERTLPIVSPEQIEDSELISPNNPTPREVDKHFAGQAITQEGITLRQHGSI